MRAFRLTAIIGISLAWALPASGQAPPDVGETADRPGFADSSVLTGRGHVLFEMGFTLARDSGERASVRTLTWPQVQLHGGLTPRIDLSMIWDGLVSAWMHQTSPGIDDSDTTHGLDDIRVGAKLGLLRRPRTSLALIGYVTLPIGSDIVSRRYADPLTRLAWSVSFSDTVSLFGTADLQAARDDDDTVRAKPAASAALGGTIGRGLDAFAGVVAEPPALASRPNVWSIEAGLVHAIGERQQIDVWVSRRVSGDGESWFVSAGFVRRIR